MTTAAQVDPMRSGLAGHLDLVLEFCLDGDPQPWRAPEVKRRGLRHYAITPERVKVFERDVAVLAASAAGPSWVPPEGPLALSILVAYHRQRPGPWAPFKVTRPDSTNLCKSIEDGIEQGGVIADDGQIAVTMITRTEGRQPEGRTETWVRLYRLLRGSCQ